MLKTTGFALVGGLCGALIGGPVGLVAGAKVGTVLQLTTAVFESTAGREDKQLKEIIIIIHIV